jgi:hypothetical protein
MLLVIFGAGASYDSDPARPPETVKDDRRPPLADQLFDNREKFAEALTYFPECKPIVPLLRGTGEVEQRLEQLRDEAISAPPYPERLRQLAAVRGYL